jgi:hypothetical protein
MAGNEHEILADARRSLGGLEFFRRMIAGELPPLTALIGFQIVEIAEGRAVFEDDPLPAYYSLGTAEDLNARPRSVRGPDVPRRLDRPPTLLRRVQTYRRQRGDRCHPASLLTRLAAEGRGFHDSLITPLTEGPP